MVREALWGWLTPTEIGTVLLYWVVAPISIPYSLLGCAINRIADRWVVLIASVYFAVFVVKLVRPSKVSIVDARRAAGACLKCGYDLRASTARCPECGTPFDKQTRSIRLSGEEDEVGEIGWPFEIDAMADSAGLDATKTEIPDFPKAPGQETAES